MKLLKEYFALQDKIFEYFGYEEGFRAIPLEDSTEYFWKLEQNKDGGGYIYFAETSEELDETGNCHFGEIYTQRFLPKWVFRGEEFTMVAVDTHMEGNKFLQVFDNTKEVKE